MLTFFSEKDASGKHVYDNIQFDPADKNNANALLEKILSCLLPEAVNEP